MPFRRVAPLAVVLALFPLEAPAQNVPEAEQAADRSRQFFETWGKGDYLAAIVAIEDHWQHDDRLRNSYTQMRPALDGFVVPDSRRGPVRPADPADLARYDGAVAADAIAAIVERARSTRVVIINETHDNPRDRAFVLAVAEALRPLGYSVYAAEALANWGNAEQVDARMAELARRGYPLRGDGWYVTEPMFGNLVRGVLALGYRPQAYEYSPPLDQAANSSRMTMEEQVALRERGQAENLARAIAESGPEAKFLIHVGYSHATERPMAIGAQGQQQVWMAGQLAQLTGIDPLTVDQADMSEFGQPGLHAALAPRLAGRPRVFLADGRSVATGPNGAATDLQVVHPPITAVGGRPDWLQRTGRQAVAIPAELLPASGRRLIQAFGESDAAEAVPLDQVLVRAGEAPPVLYLPEGMTVRWAVQEGG